MLISRHPIRRLAREQRGFTLIETLVAMVTGIIVTGALFAILEVSLHQSSRITDVVQATQLGRTTMTHMVDDLHSACLGPGFVPIQAGTTESKLVFINAYTNKTIIPSATESASEGAHRREIRYQGGNLTEFSEGSTAGESPEFTSWAAASPSTGVRIGENISQTEETVEGTPTKIPVFQYFEYAKESSSNSKEALSSLNTTTPLKPPSSGFTAAEAAKVASVRISFRAAAADKNTALDRTLDLRSQVTFAFSAPSSEATIEAKPCE